MQITHVELVCRSVHEMEAFYAGSLGFEVHSRSVDSVCFNCGWTKLTFRQKSEVGVYHFAFNIPQQQFEPAAWWLASRVSLVKDAHGRDRFSFDSWHAEAVYCLDPQGNRVELIAREGMRPDVFGAFDIRQVIGVSEVGIATEHVAGLAEELKKRCSLHPYKETTDVFCPVGSAAGMLILVETGRPWFPDFEATAVPLPVALRFRDEEYKWFTLKFREEEGSIVRVSHGFDWED